MEIETTLSQDIYTAGENAEYDAACKRLLSEKIILAWIMKACLEEYRECSISEIAEKYIEGEPQIAEIPVSPDETAAVGSRIRGMQTEDITMTEGTITYDIRFLATVPGSGACIRLIINVEAQNDFYPGYPLIKRAIYYCSRMISSQYGTEFSASHYEKIKKVYSIWICTNPPKYRENTITKYAIAEKPLVGLAAEKIENYDLMSVVMICLGRSDSENYEGILKLLDTLFSPERNAEEKERILQEDFHIEMTQTLEREVSIMCNLSKGVEERGLQKGLQRGIQKGIQTATFQAIQSLMESMQFSIEQAMTALKIPEEEKPKYISMFKNKS